MQLNVQKSECLETKGSGNATSKSKLKAVMFRQNGCSVLFQGHTADPYAPGWQSRCPVNLLGGSLCSSSSEGCFMTGSVALYTKGSNVETKRDPPKA